MIKKKDEPKETISNSDNLSSLYEKLRGIALKQNRVDGLGPYGMAVLCDKGLLSWIEACRGVPMLTPDLMPVTRRVIQSSSSDYTCTTDLRNAFVEMAMRKIRKEYPLCLTTSM